MTTNPKSKCYHCGHDVLIPYKGIANCYSCKRCGTLQSSGQDQPNSRLDEVAESWAKGLAYSKVLFKDGIKSAIKEYTTELEKENIELQNKINDLKDAQLDGASKLIEENLHLNQSPTKANEELVELRKDKKRLDWLTGLSRNRAECFNTESGSWIVGSSYDRSIRQAIDSAIAAQEKMK